MKPLPDQDKWNNQNDRKKEPRESPFLQEVEDGNTVKKEVDPNQIPVHHRITPTTKKKPSWLMPFLTTIATAGIIGTGLGLLLMQLFIGLDEEEVIVNESQMNSSPAAAIETNESKTVDLPALSAYVLQTGVFMEEANAVEWSEFYETDGKSTFIWKRGEEYYLFLGIYGTEDEARTKVEELQGDGVDVFMKQWETEKKEVTLEEEGIDWLLTFQEAWDEALRERETEKLLSLAQDAPSTSTLEDLIEKLTNSHQNNDEFFLNVMHAYADL